MIAAADCEPLSRLIIEFLPRNAGFSTDLNTEKPGELALSK